MEGKVKSLTKFGAFILLPDGSTGMVHISEVAHTYVNDIHDHLSEGQAVKVMVIGMENGKINLSIKRTTAAPQRPQNRDARPPFHNGAAQGFAGKPSSRGAYRNDHARTDARPAAPAEPQKKSLDDMLKQFMSESESNMASNKQYNDHRTRTRRR